MTPDKDLGQCIVGDRVVQVDRRQNKVTNETTFRALRGFGPRSMPDYLALTGDTADGIPGLAGFGEKSASLVIGAYEHLEHIPDDASAWTVRPRGARAAGGDAGRRARGGRALSQAGDARRHRPVRRDAGRGALRRRATRAIRGLVRSPGSAYLADRSTALERDLTGFAGLS